MSKKDRNQAEEIQANSILGDAPVLTAQQKAEIERQGKAARRAEKKEQIKQLRDEAKKRLTSDSDSKQMTIIVLVMIGILVIAAVFLSVSQAAVGGMDAKEGMTYFLDNMAIAEMSDKGISAAITEAYYTKNGGMYVHFNFANAEDTSQHPTHIYVKLLNGDDEVIASASTNKVNKDYYVIRRGYNTYELFIPEKYVQIADDPLSEISYEVTVESEEYK